LPPDAAIGFRDRWFVPTSKASDLRDGVAPIDKPSAGVWVHDEATLALRYQATGHADPWLRAWLDVAAEATSGPHAAVAEPLLRAAMKPTAPGQCGSCHSIERDAAGRLAIQWRPFDPALHAAGFTRFDHKPHAIQPQTSDCATCHRMTPTSTTPASYAGDDPHVFPAGFEPISKKECASCHAPHAAGDGCLQCHTYHGGNRASSADVRGAESRRTLAP
jgi:hypothetical protein